MAFALVFLFHQGVPSAVLRHVIGREGARCFRENGWVGVQLFFILSGYLIGGQLLRRVASGQSIQIRDFYVQRFLRIMPAYWLVLAIYLRFQRCSSAPVQDKAAMCGFSLLSRFRPQSRGD